ncbi:endonuclease [Orpheovirus IHUMI-LCC2]|uniref:UV damage endonuclease UvdE n=1 Tax=Orpheovirus IHUMI-LCC2 TaxID=2023057 RepID=A0A2I2L3D9_9VIRU|nr:endonuclease [Orpheovirus IHUMI-LCC2]SNW61989.1 UV damage endonuclease UvdE [Orpheovirus IHUMI-LCC2]
MTYNMRLGLCCINTKLREKEIFTSRTCRLETAKDKGLTHIVELAKKNIMDLVPMIIWNELNGIKVFRMSSEMFPHVTNPKLFESGLGYSVDMFANELLYIGNIVRTLGHRVTFHPGQFNVIGTKDNDILNKTIMELSSHARILDLMGCDGNSVLVIHGGGVYGNKDETIKRWVKNYNALPDIIKRRLVLENCEKCFTVEDCLRMSSMVDGILPVVLDIHHYQCYSQLHPEVTQESLYTLVPKVVHTWWRKGLRPKFHISEQGTGKIGHHSDYISHIPDIFWDLCQYAAFDLMIEAKAKEQAIIFLYNKYPILRSNQYIPNPYVYNFKEVYPYLF